MKVSFEAFSMLKKAHDGNGMIYAVLKNQRALALELCEKGLVDPDVKDNVYHITDKGCGVCQAFYTEDYQVC
jgi:hypothetical protein